MKKTLPVDAAANGRTETTTIEMQESKEDLAPSKSALDSSLIPKPLIATANKKKLPPSRTKGARTHSCCFLSILISLCCSKRVDLI